MRRGENAKMAIKHNRKIRATGEVIWQPAKHASCRRRERAVAFKALIHLMQADERSGPINRTKAACNEPR